MEIALESPSPPVNMLQGHITPEETSFMLHCHDKSFKKVTAVGDDGQPLLLVEGAAFGKSWSMRRKVTDATGAHLYDFRYENFNLNNGWFVENLDGDKICTL